jgi:hypothetical protein
VIPSSYMGYILIVPIVIIIAILFIYARDFYLQSWLNKHGQHIVGEVNRVYMPAKLQPIKIVEAKWTDPRTNETHTFSDRAPITLRLKKGEPVDILIDPDNPKRYNIVTRSINARII